MGARLELEAAVCAVAAHDEADLLEAAETRFIQADYLGLVALALGVHAVHPVQIACEERALFTAGAAAYLYDDVPVVVGVFGEEEYLQLFLERWQRTLSFIELCRCKIPELVVGFGIVQYRERILDGVLRLFILAVLRDHRPDG